MSEDTSSVSNFSPALALRSWWLMVVVPVFAIFIYPIAGSGRDTLLVIFIALLLSFTCQMGIFLGVSHRSWRFILFPFAIVLTSFAVGQSINRSFDWVGASITAISLGIIFVTLEVIKLSFGRFEKPTMAEVPDGLQFRISHLMIATAAVALLISLIKALMPFAQSTRGYSSTIAVIAICFVCNLVVITLSSTWALMGRRVGFRLFIGAAVSMLVATSNFFIAPDSTALWLWSFMLAICWGTVTLQLWLLRLSGLRFVRD